MWRLRHNQYESGEDPKYEPDYQGSESPVRSAKAPTQVRGAESQAQGHHEAGASPVPASQVGF